MMRLLLLFYVFLCVLHHFISSKLTINEAKSQLMSWQTNYISSTNIHQTEVYTVPSEEAGTKLQALAADKWLGSLKRAKELSKNGFITVNGFKSFGTRILNTGDEVIVSQQLEPAPSPDEIDIPRLERLVNFTNNLLDPSRNPALHVLYEDDHLAVVFKPAGVHSLEWLGTMKKAFFCLDHTLPLILKAPPSSLPRPLPCHRLDMRVSGCLVCAKSGLAMQSIAQQFQQHTIQKEYTAVVVGDFQQNQLVIRDSIDNLESETEVIVLARTACNVYGTLTTLKLLPKTGRRHQLRRHCAGAGHPILGDDLYHSAAGWSNKEDRLMHLAAISSKLQERGDSKDENSDLIDRSSIPYDQSNSSRIKDFPHVRKGVGLFLSATGVEILHPVFKNTLRVEAPLPPRFQLVLIKASRGHDWKEGKNVRVSTYS